MPVNDKISWTLVHCSVPHAHTLRTEASYFSYFKGHWEKKEKKTHWILTENKSDILRFLHNYLRLDSIPSLSLWHDFIINIILGHRQCRPELNCYQQKKKKIRNVYLDVQNA